jgi:hypothetical protein
VKKFVETFPNHSTYSICQDNFSEAMRRIGEKIRNTVGPPCVDRPLVDISDAPNLQADCNVEERIPIGNGRYDQRVIPRCDANVAGPCWNLTEDATQCPASGHRIEVDRKGEMPAEGTQQSIRCLTQVVPNPA